MYSDPWVSRARSSASKELKTWITYNLASPSFQLKRVEDSHGLGLESTTTQGERQPEVRLRLQIVYDVPVKTAKTQT